MRDLMVVLPAVLWSLVAIKRPWIGILVWVWLSLMNPHRLCYGFAYSAPLSAIAGGCTLLGFVLTKERSSPFKGAPVVWFAVYVVWITLSWRFGPDPDGDLEQYSKVIKMCFMIFVALSLMQTKKQILVAMWVNALSLGILGAKGGLFTVITGGSYRVLGPPGSLLSDNNHLATALAMTVPLLRFLQLQVTGRWARRGMGLMLLLCAASAFGSYSRGALLAMGSMVTVMWWRGNNRVGGAIAIALAVVALLAFMPDAWMDRMNSIKTHDQDQSAQARFNSWFMAWNAAQHHILGLGFITYKPEFFALYAPNPDVVFAAHSIYFQVMGSHGFIGLFIFLGFLFSTWRTADWIRKHTADVPQARWAYDLASLSQVSLVAFLTGGAFLSLAQFDLPFNLMVLLTLTRVWVQTRGWEHEDVPQAQTAVARRIAKAN